jgi:hypothetical protein
MSLAEAEGPGWAAPSSSCGMHGRAAAKVGRAALEQRRRARPSHHMRGVGGLCGAHLHACALVSCTRIVSCRESQGAPPVRAPDCLCGQRRARPHLHARLDLLHLLRLQVVLGLGLVVKVTELGDHAGATRHSHASRRNRQQPWIPGCLPPLPSGRNGPDARPHLVVVLLGALAEA